MWSNVNIPLWKKFCDSYPRENKKKNSIGSVSKGYKWFPFLLSEFAFKSIIHNIKCPGLLRN